MIVPNGWEEMTDEELEQKLSKTYNPDVAVWLVEVLRGRVEVPGGIN